MDPGPRTVTEVLARQLRHRYAVLERSLRERVGLEEARFVLGSRPCLAWHAAHLDRAIASTAAALAFAPSHESASLGDPMELPADEEAWSARVAGTLESAAQLLDSLAQATDAQLELAPAVPIHPGFEEALATRRAFLEGHLFHVTYHLGSMAVLRAELGLDGPPR